MRVAQSLPDAVVNEAGGLAAAKAIGMLGKVAAPVRGAIFGERSVLMSNLQTEMRAGLRADLPIGPSLEGIAPVYSSARDVSKFALLQRSEITAPNGPTIRVVSQDNVVVPVDKVEVYARGGSPDPFQELSALQAFKQQERKVFDLDPSNQIRIDQLKNMQHNFERSQAMAKNLESIGLHNTIENNDLILRNLLETGRSVTQENRVWVPGTLNGPNGSLRVNST